VSKRVVICMFAVFDLRNFSGFDESGEKSPYSKTRRKFEVFMG
jgi:hypothetical protein